jgi:hypothetical protein
MNKNKLLASITLLAILISACAAPAAEAEAENSVPVTGGEPAEEAVAEAPAAQVEAAAEAPAAAPPAISISAPLDLPASLRTLQDSDSSLRASEKRVLSGDNFNNNLFERPFSSLEMVYQPDLDIQTVDFSEDDQFFFFTIRLYDLHPDTGALTGYYGVEFDRTLTGRGDLLVFTESAGPGWASDNVTIFIDENTDVGGPQPLIPDTGFSGSGYEGVRIMEGGDAAFARLDPADPKAVQFAISRSLLGEAEQFLWGAWADSGLKNPAAFDYNDLMRSSDAGSPFKDNSDYPVKDLFNVDNTCRLPYGFPQAGGTIKGMCVNTPPPSEKKPPTDEGCPGEQYCYPVGNQIICVCIEPQ